MKYISNLHTHTNYCDGKNSIEENIKYAIEKEFISLGFSGHSNFIKDDCSMTKEGTIKYLSDIKKYKEIYKDKIQIYSGIEADYYSNLNKDTDKEMALDYRIGSVHFIDDNKDYFCIDMSKNNFEETIKHFGNIRIVIKKYFDNIIKMTNTQKPDIIGHLDLVRKYNFKKEYFTEEENWYIEKVEEVLENIKENNSIVEVNIKLMSKSNLDAHYPNKMTIKKILKMNIPLTLNTDAHSINGLDKFYYEAIEELKKLDKQQLRLYDLLEQAVYTKELFLERNNAISDRRKKINATIAQEREKFKLVDTSSIEERLPLLRELLTNYNSLSATEKNSILKNFVKKIEYKREKSAPEGDIFLKIYYK